MKIERMDRRAFLIRAAAACAALGGFSGALGCAGRREVEVERRPRPCGARLTPAAWATMEAAQALLLPSAPNSPGAKDVRATAYLDAALVDSEMDPAECEAVHRGIAALDAGALLQGAASFSSLAPEAQAVTLDALVRAQGTWFRVVMGFTMEAFLGDPIHGGNPGGVGWAFVGHVPGWPQPVEATR